MRLVFAAASTADAGNLSPTTERLINFYPASAPDGAKGSLILRNVPGLTGSAQVPGPFLRRLVASSEQLYAVCAGGLYSVGAGGNVVRLANVPDDENTTVAGYRTALSIAAGGAYLRYSGGNIVQPAGGRIVNVGSVAFLDQYIVIGERDGREVEWTEVGAPGVRDALQFATAEADDDSNVRVIRCGPYLAVMKAETTELWANTGASGEDAELSRFGRVSAAVWQRGLKAFNLVTETPFGLFFVGNDGCAYTSNDGAQPQQCSTAAVDEALQNGQPTHCFYYEVRGHRFCVIRFADRPAWVFDAAVGLWHERSSGVSHGPWDVIDAAYCYGRWYLASLTGAIYTLSALPLDGGETMRRTAVSRPLFADGRRLRVHQVTFFGRFGRSDVEEFAPNVITTELGFPLLTDSGDPIYLEQQAANPGRIRRPAKMWIRVSRDGGNTFGEPKERSFGRVGEYLINCAFKACFGQARQMVVEMNITDPVDAPIMAEAEVRAS